jgi:predicted TIM-barrel fold metal-dependent hydrolase
MFWFLAFLVGTIYNPAFDVSDNTCAKWQFFTTALGNIDRWSFYQNRIMKTKNDFVYQDHTGLWAKELGAWVPSVIFDAHVHLGPPAAMGSIQAARKKDPITTFTHLTLENARAVYADLYRGVKVSGMIAFGFPLREVDVFAANNYIIDLMQADHGIKGFMLADPRDLSMSINQFSQACKRNIRLAGVKSHCDLQGRSCLECSTHEYVTDELLEFMNAEELVLMLHTAGTGMGDAGNQRFLMSIASKYSKIKIILAHLGRYFEPHQCIDFLGSEVVDHPNIFLEMSSATVPEVYTTILSKTHLRKKLLFGSDLPFGLITGQECWCQETGLSFITRDDYAWSNPTVQACFPDRHTRLTYNAYHALHALKTAVERLHLPAEETTAIKNDIFYNNAACSLFALQAVTQPKSKERK